MRQKPRRFSLWENEEGFTLVEVLVALSLLGTLSLVVWAASFSGGRTLERVSSGIRRNIELLRMDSAVRSCAQRITIPYWLAGTKSAGPGQDLSIPWLDGIRDRSLVLSFRDGMLVIDDGSQTDTFPGVQDAQMEIAPPAQGTAPALIVIVRLEGREPVRIIAPLGAVPFPVVGQNGG